MILFTSREKELAFYLALGMNLKDISKILGVNVKTVYSHKYSALKKIGARKNKDLISWLRTDEARLAITGKKRYRGIISFRGQP